MMNDSIGKSLSAQAEKEIKKAEDAFEKGDFDLSVQFYQEANEYYKRLGTDKESQQKCFKKIAEIYENQRKLPEAKENYLIAFDYGWLEGLTRADLIAQQERDEEAKFFTIEDVTDQKVFKNVDSIQDTRELSYHLLKMDSEKLKKHDYQKLLNLRNKILEEFLKKGRHELSNADFEAVIELVASEKSDIESNYQTSTFTIPLLNCLLKNLEEDKLSRCLYLDYIGKLLEKSVVLFNKGDLEEILTNTLLIDRQDEETKLSSLSSVTKVLNSIAEVNFQGLSRDKLEDNLIIIRIYDQCSEFNKCKFFAWYAIEAWRRIPSDESGLMRTFQFCKINDH